MSSNRAISNDLIWKHRGKNLFLMSYWISLSSSIEMVYVIPSGHVCWMLDYCWMFAGKCHFLNIPHLALLSIQPNQWVGSHYVGLGYLAFQWLNPASPEICCCGSCTAMQVMVSETNSCDTGDYLVDLQVENKSRNATLAKTVSHLNVWISRPFFYLRQRFISDVHLKHLHKSQKPILI